MSSSMIPMDVWNKLAYDLLAINPVVLVNFGQASTWANSIVDKIFKETVQVLSFKVPLISLIKPFYTYRQQTQTRLSELGAEGGPIDQASKQIARAEVAYNQQIKELQMNPSTEFFEAHSNTLADIQFDFTKAVKKHQDLIAEKSNIEDNLAKFPSVLATLMQPILQQIRN